MRKPTSGVEFQNAVSSEMATIKGTALRLKDVLLGVRKALLEIASNRDITAEAMMRQRREQREVATQLVDAILLRAQNAKQDAEKVCASLFESPADAIERLTRLMEQGSAWTRCERLLKADMQPQQVIEKAATEGDLPALRALRVELPSYLHGHKGLEALVNLCEQKIEEAEFPLISEAQRAARALQKELHDNWHTVITSANAARRAINDNPGQSTINPVMLLGWEKGSIIRVEEKF